MKQVRRLQTTSTFHAHVYYSYSEPPLFSLSTRISQVFCISGILIWLAMGGRNRILECWKSTLNPTRGIAWMEYILTSKLKSDSDYATLFDSLAKALERNFERTGSIDDFLRA